ncbi:hypothetical protein LIER_41271 [Lithospermum erythrorhizon]|uniref:B3 domain-containing protein n=1 Tax=Lithospermum erythrorhizon TaxID=34254 RepID=A0AAV3R6Z1_LITER
MGRKWTDEELPLLILATVAIKEEEKEAKKLSCSFISEGLVSFWPKKKRSVLANKKGEKTPSDHAEKEVLKLSIIWEEPSFKNPCDHADKEAFKNKIFEEKGLEKTENLEKKVPRILENDLVPENKKMKNSNNNDGNVKKRKRTSGVLEGSNPPPTIPEEFKKIISKVAPGKNISEVKLVVQKKLEDTDCDGGQNRFSIPKDKLREHFLEDVENGERYQMVHIIDPSLNHYDIKLSMWKPFYALNGDSWKMIKKTNNLEPGMIMQLWGFRVNNELWFALVNLTTPIENVGMEEAEKGNDNGGSSVTGGSSE